MAVNQRASLLGLPPEIREQIYSLILNPAANRVHNPDEYTDYDYRHALVLFKINHQIYHEARRVFRDLNIFVRIETPWPEAKETVALEGHVPILMKDLRATRFREHSLSVVIDGAHSPIPDGEAQHFVILVNDLEKFTKTWFYVDISNPGLNQFLRLTLRLHDPYTPGWEEKRIAKWKQQRLLMPFAMIKNLAQMDIEGDPKPFVSVEKELREGQKVPYESPEHCLREVIKLKAEGNTELNNGCIHAALKLYTKAWEAMHIIVKGRQRHVHGDRFFETILTEDPFKSKNGQAERLILRIQLVANTTLAYLKLEDYEEACFWGMRTIGMLREGMGIQPDHDVPAEVEAFLRFPAADQLGKIYYRTALAFKGLSLRDSDAMTRARKLLRVAILYLPHDKSIKKEIAACAITIG